MRKLILVLALMTVAVSSHAATAWRIDVTKDAQGDTVCVYKYAFKKIYQSPDFGTVCPMTIEVSDE